MISFQNIRAICSELMKIQEYHNLQGDHHYIQISINVGDVSHIYLNISILSVKLLTSQTS